MDLKDYAAQDATGLAALVKAGEVSGAELADCANRAIDAVNGTINAVIRRLDPPVAGDDAGPFAGVPFLVKDLVLAVGGIPQMMGTRMLAEGGFVPPVDSELFTRFRKAGLNTIGITATPEFGFNATTEAVLNGPTRNPYNTERSPGGSSGGSAAAVAAGIVPVAHANDGGGSIRIPAASCGLVGLKPSRGRIPFGPYYGMPLLGMANEFVVTRTVRDCAALLDAVSGPDIGATLGIAPPAMPYAGAIAADTRPLKVALVRHWPKAPAVEPQIDEALSRTARLFEANGHMVEEAAPDYDVDAFNRANFAAWMSFLAVGLNGVSAAMGREPGPDTVEAVTLACARAGNRLTAMDIEDVFMVMNTVSRSIGAFLTQYDVILMPVLKRTPLPLGYLNQNDPDLDAQGWYDRLFDAVPFTAPFNMTGLPAITVPAGMHDAMPVPIQMAAGMGREDVLLQLAHDLERQQPWRDIRPGVFAG
ncbi:amidase [Tistrella bauzanensis]|uniref:Amidase n=1 Tax=Tistrella bauzanensis TaxID=657419 RepID=A0ABQ1I9N0_9PROT|nr:amidase family protein [Tistrella bauzanensis]GGB30580.1 amidase [Tistrella bauzanensis]